MDRKLALLFARLREHILESQEGTSQAPLLQWQRMPLLRDFILGWQNWRDEQATPCYRQIGVTPAHPHLLPYPIDMSPLLALNDGDLDKEGVLYSPALGDAPATYHPSNIAQYALAHWNAYLVNGNNKHQEAFLIQVAWLLAHEQRLPNDVSIWPLPFDVPLYHAPQPWLSALTQGNIISTLIRAYQLTKGEIFLQIARRAVNTFALDILDGGVSTPIGDSGIFFEEVAVYPTAHILNGYILSLFGLYDYVAATKDSAVKTLIERSLVTLHMLLRNFDTGYWTRYDLLHKRLAPWFYHSLHITLLEVLAKYSGCEHCTVLASRWARYQHSFFCRLRYLLTSRFSAYWNDRLMPRLRQYLLRSTTPAGLSLPQHVYVQIPSLPVRGGMHRMLTTVAEVMHGRWKIRYLTHHTTQRTERRDITTFGGRKAHPWQFPGVWLYFLAGWWRLFLLLRHRPGYSLILPQDGTFTGAFAALLGKMAGIRVVCMDHGNITLLDSVAFRQECKAALRAYSWPKRLFFNFRYLLYWPSLRLLARISTICADQFLVAGDEVAEAYRKYLNVHPGRIVRYAYMIDSTRFAGLDKAARVRLRVGRGIAKDAIIITMINRLSTEKGMDFALEGIARAIADLPHQIRTRIKVLIAGEGPLRAQVEADIERHHLDFACMLWGDATPDEVVMLLGMSDIFLYSGTRGTNYSIAVLEAMAAGCAVVATRSPQSNARLLADGRGIAIMSGSATEISIALTDLCKDLDLCQHMGQKAREYVAKYHSAEMFRRSLLRASYFSPPLNTE